jgi:hypothetical protein
MHFLLLIFLDCMQHFDAAGMATNIYLQPLFSTTFLAVRYGYRPHGLQFSGQEVGSHHHGSAGPLPVGFRASKTKNDAGNGVGSIDLTFVYIKSASSCANFNYFIPETIILPLNHLFWLLFALLFSNFCDKMPKKRRAERPARPRGVLTERLRMDSSAKALGLTSRKDCQI